MAPPSASAADLVVWWHEGYYTEEDEAVREIIAAFEQESGKQVELVIRPMEELPDKIAAALEVGQPPDFAFGFWLDTSAPQWALEGRLVDLSDAIGHFSDLFDPAQLDRATLLNSTTGRKALYGLPMGQITHLTHVWKSLLEQAGFTLENIPREWEAYWSFWCDEVQPALRQATGRDNVRGRGSADVGRSGRYREWLRPVRDCLRGGLCDIRRSARDRRAGDQAGARRGHRQLHDDLSQGLHPA
jgi:multiple sugar transport system substrate-binding protein